MPDFTSELDKFFNTSHFARTVTYTPSGGSPTTLTVIFDDAHSATNLEGEAFNTNPMVTCKSSDVVGEVGQGTFTISSTTYYIRRVLPDGTGISQVELSKDQ